MPNFSIPLSGLAASSTALSTISNNLANLNTTGFKDSTVNFRDMFYQSLGTNGAGDQLQIGAGASVASINTNFSGGSTQNTGVNTDVAITGNGFFVVQNGSNTLYTRAGNFTRDSDGYLVTADGYQVMGHTAANNTAGGLNPIQLQDGMINPPMATTAISMQSNLSADDTVCSYNNSIAIVDSLGTSHMLNVTYTRTATGWDYSAALPSSEVTGGSGTSTVVQSGSLASDSYGNLSSPSAVTFNIANLSNGANTLAVNFNPNSVQSNLSAAVASTDSSYSANVTVYDTLGTSHVLSTSYTRTATGWDYNVTLPSSEINGGVGTSTSVASGSLSFNSSGTLISTAPISISIANLSDGAGTLAFNWNLADSNGTGLITQVYGQSSTGSTTQDGYGSGTLTDFSVTSDGTVMGKFTNGTKALGQIALANFANLEGLTKQGNNNYAATISSGSAVIGAPGTSSLGTLTGSALELSNVDMSTEFSDLIIAERGFQANAKSVTTFDQIAQDTINLIR